MSLVFDLLINHEFAVVIAGNGYRFDFFGNLGLFGDRWQMWTSAPKGVAFYFYIL